MGANGEWWAGSRGWPIALVGGLLAVLASVLIPAAIAVVDDEPKVGATRQVTVFAIQAQRGGKTTEPRLDAIKARLEKLKPGYGFTLLDVSSGSIVAGESAVVSKLANGCKIKTTLTQSADDSGKFEIRCEMSRGKDKPTATRVKTPLNQLFLLEYPLADGSVLLVGIGAR